MGGKGKDNCCRIWGESSRVVSSVYFTFFNDSVLNPLFIGVVRPWFLPVCSEEVDSVCWSPIGQDILSHWHLLEITMIICRWENQVENRDKHVAYHQLWCSIIRTGLWVGDHLRVGHGASPGKEGGTSALWKWFCTPLFSIFSFTLWSVSSKPHNPHNQDILPPVLPQWTLCTTQPPCRGSLPKPRIPCNEAFLRFESMKKYLFWSFCRVSKKGLFLNFQGYVGRPNILVILVMKCIGRGSAVHTLNLSRALLV